MADIRDEHSLLLEEFEDNWYHYKAFHQIYKTLNPTELRNWVAVAYYGAKKYLDMKNEPTVINMVAEMFFLTSETVKELISQFENRHNNAEQIVNSNHKEEMDLDNISSSSDGDGDEDVVIQMEKERTDGLLLNLRRNANKEVHIGLTGKENVTQILANHFRINRIGQINKNELFEQIKTDNIQMDENEVESILKELHSKNKIFYIDPLIHQL
eukprot:120853_1